MGDKKTSSSDPKQENNVPETTNEDVARAVMHNQLQLRLPCWSWQGLWFRPRKWQGLTFS